MFQRKFWVLVKNDGLLKTYLRGHMASRHSYMTGGLDDPIKPAGMDEFGNKYYEDFKASHRNQRRWVEYSDYFITLGITGDRVPPKWHGWLSHQYDDVPSDYNRYFVKPIYLKKPTENLSYTPLFYKSEGSLANVDRDQFISTNRDRRAKPWIGPEAGALKEGKRILVPKFNLYKEPV